MRFFVCDVLILVVSIAVERDIVGAGPSLAFMLISRHPSVIVKRPILVREVHWLADTRSTTTGSAGADSPLGKPGSDLGAGLDPIRKGIFAILDNAVPTCQ